MEIGTIKDFVNNTPSIAKKEARRHYINLGLTEKEKNNLEKVASKKGVSQQEFIRQCLLPNIIDII